MNILTLLKRAKAKASQVPSSTRPVPCNAVTQAFGGHDSGDVWQASPAERYESRREAATVRHYDSEDPSSEDGEEGVDLLPHEPFPCGCTLH